jgi:hypothetical protein
MRGMRLLQVIDQTTRKLSIMGRYRRQREETEVILMNLADLYIEKDSL